MKINYFSGEIFDQLNKTTDQTEKKRIITSIKTVVGNCTERFIKYYYDNTNIFEVNSIQKEIKLNKGDFLFRNSTVINNILYEQLTINNVSKIEKFNQFEIKINPKDFYKYILKDILKQNIKDFNKNDDINMIIRNKLQKDYPFLSEIKEKKYSIIFILKTHMIFTKEESDFIIFLKDISVLSNQKQKIRTDMFIKEKHTDKQYIVEVKSRITKPLTKKDIYSSIYYPIYYNHYNNTNIGLNLIYFGKIEDYIQTEINKIKKNYKKFSNGIINIKPFETIIQILKNKYEHADLIGIEVNNKKILDLDNSKYTYTGLEGIYSFPPKFILNYTFNIDNEINNKKLEDNKFQKEIRRDNKRL